MRILVRCENGAVVAAGTWPCAFFSLRVYQPCMFFCMYERKRIYFSVCMSALPALQTAQVLVRGMNEARAEMPHLKVGLR